MKFFILKSGFINFTRRIFFPVIFITVALAVSATAKMDVYLHTKRAESKLIEVAVPRFFFSGKDTGNYGWQAANIINKDLRFSGYFKMNENFDFMSQASARDMRLGKIDFREWRTLASNFLVKGSLQVDKKGDMIIEARVYDLQTKRLFFSKRYIGARSIFRQIVHQFSDDFVLRLTGEKGVARSRIAYISRINRHKELFVMDYDGFGPKQLTSDRSIVILPDWNPVRDLILFTTYRYRNPDLYAINLKSKTRYPISRRVGLNVTGEWSPDGKKVVYSLSRKGNSEIYYSNADGSNRRQLTHSRAIETSPTWSPDGSKIAFTSDRSGSPQIYIMNIDGSERKRLTYKGSYNDGAAWAPKGNTIVYSSLLSGKFNIATIDVRSREVNQLTIASGTNEAPSWSPNGRHIVFSSTRRGGKQIYIMNMDSSNQTQVTFSRGRGYTPTWGSNPE